MQADYGDIYAINSSYPRRLYFYLRLNATTQSQLRFAYTWLPSEYLLQSAPAAPGGTVKEMTRILPRGHRVVAYRLIGNGRSVIYTSPVSIKWVRFRAAALGIPGGWSLSGTPGNDGRRERDKETDEDRKPDNGIGERFKVSPAKPRKLRGQPRSRRLFRNLPSCPAYFRLAAHKRSLRDSFERPAMAWNTHEKIGDITIKRQ